MTDMTSEPVGPGPQDATSVDASAAPTEPIPVQPPLPRPESDSHVSVPKKWLLAGGGVVLAVVLLGGTFAFGAAVGSRTSRFDGRGPAMQGQVQGGGGYGMMPRSQGELDDRDGDEGFEHGRGFGGREGRGGPQGGQLSAPQSPNDSQ